MLLQVSYEVGRFRHQYTFGMYLCTDFKDIQNLNTITGFYLKIGVKTLLKCENIF